MLQMQIYVHNNRKRETSPTFTSIVSEIRVCCVDWDGVLSLLGDTKDCTIPESLETLRHNLSEHMHNSCINVGETGAG